MEEKEQEIKGQYVEEINKQYNYLIKKEKESREKTLYQSMYEGGKTFSLQDIHISNEKKYQAKLQNIINSIPLIHQGKILLFKTITLNPKANPKIYINLKTFNKNNVKQQYQKQNRAFKEYLREFRRIKNKEYIYIFEVAENKINLHLHKVGYFNTITNIKDYIKHTFIAKSKNPLIGRTELKFDYKQKEQILNLFNEFNIKTHGKITLKSFTDKKTKEKFYIIPESKVGPGNFIKIAFIEKQTNDDKDKYIEKYLFKYLLKQKIKGSDDYVASLDSKVCKVSGINQLTYSERFFRKRTSSKSLFKLNDKLYSQYKYLDLRYDRNYNLYHTIELMENREILFFNNKYYFMTKKIILLDLDSTYTKQIASSTFEALYNKYQDPDSKMTTKKDGNIYLATLMFFIYNYDKKEIFNEYGVDTVDDLADYFQLEEEMYQEEQENERLRRLEEIYDPICALDYHLHQIIDDFIIEADIPVISLINSKLEELQPSEPYPYF